MNGIEAKTPRDDARLFDDRRGFFRARSRVDVDAQLDAIARPGPPLDADAANALTRRFVDVLTEGRPLAHDLPDTVDHVERNNLLLLFSPGVQARLERLYPRMPLEMADAWRAALRGGDPRDSFGPLTAEERLDEARVEADLQKGRRLHRRRLAGSVLVLVLLVAGVVWWQRRDTGDAVSSGLIEFGKVAERGADLRTGGPPAVEKALLARLDRPSVVRAGSGDVSDRIVLDPPPADLPVPVGAVAATLFRYNGAGQVVLVGPPGWLAKACIQVSVMSASLRAFDTAYTETQPGACGKDRVFGRTATVGCTDPKQAAIMLDLVIPEGNVTLSEGGSASVAAVRVAVIGTNPAYERNNTAGQITVAQGSAVAVPSFGGAAGSTVSFDLSAPSGAPLTGSCRLV